MAHGGLCQAGEATLCVPAARTVFVERCAPALMVQGHQVWQVGQSGICDAQVDDLAALAQLCEHVLIEQALVQAIDLRSARGTC